MKDDDPGFDESPTTLRRFEGDEIYPNLYQGSYPAWFEATLHERFDVLVLTAAGLQPPNSYFDPKLLIGRVRLHDDVLTEDKKRDALNAGFWVANRVLEGKKVLVTCQAGRNRSGLVVALALHHLTGMSGSDCIGVVREKRKVEALYNEHFCAFLRTFAAR